jgi:Tat protein secretion system quality control protein TatD with DNase activity
MIFRVISIEVITVDCPYVVPKARRKEAKRNEPNFVIDVFEKICEIKNITNKDEFKEILKENFERVFFEK